jgi:hypothetical protein
MAKVNLDALIPREDFAIGENPNPGTRKDRLSIEDLKADSFFFTNLRKPDFQRETNEWESPKVANFIESFVNGDLVPAIILWKSKSGYLFVIDGSHRLSSLAAWMNDDYGDGLISRNFYDGALPRDQQKIADSTRKLVKKRVGSYEDLKVALNAPQKFGSEIVARAKNLAALAIQLQWVEGDARKAESSFFKINQQAAPIDKTELIILESRKKPNCIAARALIHGGRGHKWWAGFDGPAQKKIEELACEINNMLFTPALEKPIKTLDLPVAGKNYSSHTLPLILEFVNIVNGISQDFKNMLDDDLTGEKTSDCLQNVRRVVRRINSMHPSSLGLHPRVYFYSTEGNFKVASFLATIAFIMDLEKSERFNEFTSIRSSFEQCLLDYDYIIQQIGRHYRSANKAAPAIKDFMINIMNSFLQNKSQLDAIAVVQAAEAFKFLIIQTTKPPVTNPEFSSEVKSAVFLRDTTGSIARCSICNAFMHKNAITVDHIQRKSEGGPGDTDNAALAHPYCNTTYKH